MGKYTVAPTVALALMLLFAVAGCAASEHSDSIPTASGTSSAHKSDKPSEGASYSTTEMECGALMVNVPEGWEITSGDGGHMACTSPDGSAAFIISMRHVNYNGNYASASKDALMRACDKALEEDLAESDHGDILSRNAAEFYGYPGAERVFESSKNLFTRRFIALENCLATITTIVPKSGPEHEELAACADAFLGSVKVTNPSFAVPAKSDTSSSPASSTSTGGGSQAASTATASQKNALRAAKDYLKVMPFSHDGLVRQLEYEGYSNEDAVYAADKCGANWNKQAEKAAKQYNDLMPFSRQELINQLVYEGYTEDQAAHGADSVGL